MSTNYYRRHSRVYFQRTVTADPAAILGPVAAHVPPPARVLDLGCGSGRDLAWLKDRGYQAFGIEAAPELAGMAGVHSGCPIHVADFTTYPLENFKADLILAVGSLVHLPHQLLPTYLKHIASGLRSGQGDGYLYLSFKAGEGTQRSPDGRVFHLWREDGLRPIFHRLGLNIIEEKTQMSALASDSATTWLGYLLRARPHLTA